MSTPEGSRTEPRAMERPSRDDHLRRQPPGPAAELPPALSVAAHDVAEAVRVVGGYLELFEAHTDGSLDDAGRRYVDGIANGLRHLDRLTDGLLAFVRAAVDPLEPEDVDAGAVLDDALLPLRGELERRRTVVESAELPAVQADAGALRAILHNLVANALTFAGDEPPHIEVFAERDGAAWRLTVRDHGIGMPDDARERVLQPFERAHPRSIATGPGLGLATARVLAERRGGRLWLEPADGGGTAVHVTIPDRGAGA